MSLKLLELTVGEVIGFNKRAIADDHAKNPRSQQQHQVVRPGDLKGCLGGIFYQSGGAKPGYVHLPIENMAGLLLYRIAEGQFFKDGNKRTAFLSCFFFLFNNGYELRVDKGKMNDLLWGAKFHPSGTTRFQMLGTMRFHESGTTQFHVGGTT